MLERMKSADGTAIAFERQGMGPPLVMVLGAFCDRKTGASLAALLANDFTVYTYDRRGRGDSGATPPYAVEREIEDLNAILAAAGGHASVYGHSSGAVLALRAAASGSTIDRLVAYEPPFVEDGSRPRHGPDLAERLAALAGTGRPGDAADLFLTEAVGVPETALAPMHSSPGWEGMQAIAHTLPYDVIITNNQTMPEGLEKIAAPTLLVAGGASPSWARSAIDQVAATIPGALSLVLDGQTHGVADDAIFPVLLKFLKEPA